MFQLNMLVSRYTHKSVRLSDAIVTNCMGAAEPSMTTDSPCWSSKRVAPSRETQAVPLLSSGLRMVRAVDAGKTMGRKESECGASGLIVMHSMLGWMRGPPADML